MGGEALRSGADHDDQVNLRRKRVLASAEHVSHESFCPIPCDSGTHLARGHDAQPNAERRLAPAVARGARRSVPVVAEAERQKEQEVLSVDPCRAFLDAQKVGALSNARVPRKIR
jgi:hypothetical protein